MNTVTEDVQLISVEEMPVSKNMLPYIKILKKIDVIESRLNDHKRVLEQSMVELKTGFTEIKGLKTLIGKIVAKNQKQRQNKKGVQHPHGFAVPTMVSDELCVFMKREPGSLIARTEVTKALTTYIKEHSLQNPLKKRDILPDETLLRLFGKTQAELSTDENPMTFFNMQKYINHHFISNKEKSV